MPELSKRCLPMKSETLSSKTILKELDFSRKQFLFNETFEENLLFLANKSVKKNNKKNLMLVMLKKIISHLSERKPQNETNNQK